MVATDNHVDDALVARILGEYREMPGLCLTKDQARRLWGCDAATCQCVIEVLVARDILRWSSDGRLILGAQSPVMKTSGMTPPPEGGRGERRRTTARRSTHGR